MDMNLGSKKFHDSSKQFMNSQRFVDELDLISASTGQVGGKKVRTAQSMNINDM
jgi:hypothetical protein